MRPEDNKWTYRGCWQQRSTGPGQIAWLWHHRVMKCKHACISFCKQATWLGRCNRLAGILALHGKTKHAMRHWNACVSAGYSSVGRASDCRVLQQSDGPWFDSGWPDILLQAAGMSFQLSAGMCQVWGKPNKMQMRQQTKEVIRNWIAWIPFPNKNHEHPGNVISANKANGKWRKSGLCSTSCLLLGRGLSCQCKRNRNKGQMIRRHHIVSKIPMGDSRFVAKQNRHRSAKNNETKMLNKGNKKRWQSIVREQTIYKEIDNDDHPISRPSWCNG